MLLESHVSYLMCMLKMVGHSTVPYVLHECTRTLYLDAIFDTVCKVNVCKRHVFGETCIISFNIVSHHKRTRLHSLSWK